ncbi:carboxymuconolactone decarboxylase family protein [Amycolatopsis sp. lyj-112]|uniref:carboxymuconolactone decarboxylase family protein n=1 Tax=Amycolatopsis sp. lyj-112 TaxID=2789288 RepID=UPI00397A78E7
MRLSILDNDHRRRAKLFLAVTSKTSGVASPDIVKMLLYRPGFLARPVLDLTAEVMRGPSYWTAGEREFLAMSTAQLHECPFCVVTHAELTRIAGTGEIDPDDPASARPELRAVRTFLESITLDPDRADATAVTDLPEHAVIEALHVNLVWNIVNRLANTFGFTLQEGQLHSGTRSLHRFGYLLADGRHVDHGDVAQNLRHAVLTAPATTTPSLRTAAAVGAALRSYDTATR